MEYILEKNLNLDDTYEYFFSLLSDRFEYTVNLWREELEKKFRKKFRPIWILSAKQNDLFYKEDYIIINKTLLEIKQKIHKDKVVYLEYYEELNKEFSESKFIQDLMNILVEKQERVFILSFTSSCLDLKQSKAIILGPDPKIATIFDNKVEHIKLFEKLDLPRNKTRIYDAISKIKEKEKYPFYISSAYTSGGYESSIIYSKEELDKFFSKLRDLNKSSSFLVSDLITDIRVSPNINAMVCDKKDTRIICISDQILRGNQYLGNIYPSKASTTEKETMIQATKKVGNYLSELGFRGLFGLDFIIDRQGNIYCVDLNPRRQGGYLCNILMSKKVNIPQIELKLALGESIKEFDYTDFQPDYVWAHSKIKPHSAVARITYEFEIEKPTSPFLTVGSEYKAIFYSRNYLLINSEAGYLILSGTDYEEVKQRITKETENLISTAFEECHETMSYE